jgi:hypothetical protein
LGIIAARLKGDLKLLNAITKVKNLSQLILNYEFQTFLM